MKGRFNNMDAYTNLLGELTYLKHMNIKKVHTAINNISVAIDILHIKNIKVHLNKRIAHYDKIFIKSKKKYMKSFN